jgi:hypothetical protein
MADIITNQLTENLYFTGKAPLDSKLTPLSTIAELSTAIKGPQRYLGLEIIVLNSDSTNIPTRFILQNGISNKSWRVKDTLTVQSNAQIEPFKPYLSEGTKITVLSDETNNGQLTEYISGTKTIVTDGVEETVVDFKKVNNDGVITSNELALKRLNKHEIGTLIYLQDTIYSYTNEESITVYTDKLEEAQDKSDFTEIPTGFYIFQLVEGKEVLSQMIVNNTINSINIPIIGDDI